ncbi:hypothetical protein AAG570_006716 [Ranatra chinensis]|uniref:Ig-like domain-containing protein n=1 Tax=Ranatra chinensis TaxID=642074 RepID=A0ABD0ZBV5_9HEMI
MVSRPEKLDYYTEGESLTASCVVSNGRPVANLAWYLGEKKITEGLSQPVIYDKVPDDLHTIAQNLTRVIQASDNGKSLRCVAEHPVLVNNNSTQVNIRVHFRPKPLQGPIEYFGLTEGEEGHVTVVVMANPKPTFVWTIGDKDIYEGEEDSTGKFHVKHSVEAQNKGPGNWETVLIINDLSKEDVERNYILTATNDLGNEKYTILISTSPEPKSPEFGAGPIALIVVVVLLILVIVSVLLVARAKGRWCFAGKLNIFSLLINDTESAEHHSSTKPKATFTSVFKKKSDKVSADIDSPKTKDVTVNDEKVGDTEDNGHVALKQKNDEGVVYAELDLQTSPPSRGLLVRPENDKTEYAEIIHTKDGK